MQGDRGFQQCKGELLKGEPKATGESESGTGIKVGDKDTAEADTAEPSALFSLL